MKYLGKGNLLILPYLLVVAAALLRLAVSQPYSLVPILSCLLFFGANRPRREFVFPLIILAGTDIFLTTHRYGYPLSATQAISWIWYLAAAFLGAGVLRNSLSVRRAAGVALLASASFFLASNFAVWAEWGLYAKSFGGLAACYLAALPFFRNSLVAETIFSVLIFGVCKQYQSSIIVRRLQSVCS
ncbi:MAG: DUF6580 family putative transport protein [Terracidiphilus sp.]